MRDHDESRRELLAEVEALRKRVRELESDSLSSIRAREQKWLSIINNAPAFIALIERDGTIAFLNRTQPGTTLEESIGKTVYDFTHPAYHAMVRQCLVEAFEKRQNGFFTSIAAGPNGEDAWYDTYVAPVIVHGEVVAVTFNAIEVTQRAQAEQLLNHERNRAQLYLDIAGVILVVIDASGNIELLNRTGHELLGYGSGELIGKNWFACCVPARLREAAIDAYQGLFSQNRIATTSYESVIVTRSGEERTIAWHVTLLTDDTGEYVGTLCSGTDVTQQIKSQQALEKIHRELEYRVQQRTAELTQANQQLSLEIQERRMAEQQLEAIYDAMVDGLLVAEVATMRFVRANPAICRMLGYTTEEMLHMTVRDILPDSEMPRAFKEFQKSGERDTIVANGTPLVRKDKTTLFADVTGARITYCGKSCLLGVFRDITERKQARENLQREHQVMRELLESHDRERQLIAYEIHDGLAQQLVGAIMQFESVQFLADHNPQEALKNCDVGLKMLRKSLAETRRLIGGLRPPILDELGIVAAISHIVHDLSNQDGPAIEFQAEISFERLVPALENAVYRVVQECITNARRHSQTDRIRVRLMQRDSELRIEVTDWGIGFDPVAKQNGRFGLEGIRERARLLGGAAEIKSAPGKGTRITIDLPLQLDGRSIE